MIGRELEVAATTSLLRQADVRLLTLTGAGGSGKTRLAGAVAHELLDEFPGGVWFVPLASVHDPALVAPTIGRTLGVGEGGYESLHEALQAELRERITLLVLDNFEHVLPASHLVAELLAAAPGLKVLVTSRSILRLSGEHDYPVPPLPLPDPRAAGDSATLAHNPAVMLFVERASAVRPDFRLEGNERAVAEICAALDGLPLALELAAARAKVLSPEALRERLERRLPLLVRGPSDLPGRQQTLRATIDWSYDLLDEDERRLFAALAVFAGGCTPETAESVCGGDLDTLTSLLDKSLLRRRPGSDREERFVMLETVREYAAERLERAGRSRVAATRARRILRPARREGGARADRGVRRGVARAARRRAREPARRARLGSERRRARTRAAAGRRPPLLLALSWASHRGAPLARGRARPRR